MCISVKIAIISDLHCTNEDKASNVTRLHDKTPIKPINRHPVKSINERINKDSINANYLICLGDVTDRANEYGLNQGIDYLKEIQMELNAEELFLITGNHDVDTQNTIDPFYQLKAHNFPLSEDDIKSSYWRDKYCVIERENLILFVINTCHHIRSTNDLKTPPPFNNDALLEDIETKLSQHKATNKFKLFLCHHHPIQQSDYDDTYTSNDLIDGADKLLKILKNNGFHLVLHGHKHIIRIQYNDDLPVFASGSFSSIQNTREFDGKNTFHLVDLKIENHQCKGKIITWLYNYNSGWTKSEDPKSIFPTYTGFGCDHRNIKGFCDQIVNHFNNWYILKDKTKILLFKEVLVNFPDIEYLTPMQQDELMDYFRDQYDLEICPNIKIGANHIMKRINSNI
jgi:predicted phosphodiesterase